jgi:hypothetical protein
MVIQQGSLDTLHSLLPCEACVTGKLRKQENSIPGHNGFTALTNNPSTTHKYVSAPQNTQVSLDFGICVNQICRKDNTCFALYVDLGLSLLYVKCLPSRGVVVVSLLGNCQRWGDPTILTMDNAKEFLLGDMAA